MKLLLVLLLLCLCGCKEKNKTALTEFTGNAMTINYRILVANPLTSQKRDEIQKVILDTFEELNATYNRWNADSELSKLNRLSAHERVPISQKLERFLKVTEEIVLLSDGLFDPTIEPIQNLWKNALELGREPTQQEIEVIAPAVGWNKIHYGDGYFSKDHSLTSLDLGGIAKGLCVDNLVERLSALGLEDLYVDWGGEIRTLGEHPSQRPWTVYISRLGSPDPRRAVATVPLQDAAIATSGDYNQNWTLHNKATGEITVYFHIINPRTMHPLIATPHSIASASVLAGNCTFADGLATVAMLFPTKEEALQWSAKIKAKYPTVQFWFVLNSEK